MRAQRVHGQIDPPVSPVDSPELPFLSRTHEPGALASDACHEAIVQRGANTMPLHRWQYGEPGEPERTIEPSA